MHLTNTSKLQRKQVCLACCCFYVFCTQRCLNTKQAPILTTEHRGIQTLTSITLITILFSGLFSYPLHSSPVLLLFFILLGIKSSTKIPYRSFNLSKNTIRVFGLLLTAVAIWFLTFQYSRQSAFKVWKEAAVFAQNGKYRPAFEKYESIYPILSYNPHFLYNYGSELSLAKQYKKSITVLHQAEEQLNDADLYTYLANSYEGIGNVEKAEYYYKYINWLIPHRIYPKYRLGVPVCKKQPDG
jgi:O-antigen polymerase